MSSYVPAALRRTVAARAGFACEYCLIREDDAFFGCEVEHVIAEKHGGGTDERNLAYACLPCNRHKGTDIASIAPSTGRLVRLFDPRSDRWSDHFRLDGARIVALTETGEVTVRTLSLNHPDRLLEREVLIGAGTYPSPHA